MYGSAQFQRCKFSEKQPLYSGKKACIRRKKTFRTFTFVTAASERFCYGEMGWFSLNEASKESMTA